MKASATRSSALPLVLALALAAAACKAPEPASRPSAAEADAPAARGWIEFGLVAAPDAPPQGVHDYPHWSAGGRWAVPRDPIWTLEQPILRCRVASAARDVDALGFPAVRVTLAAADAQVLGQWTRGIVGRQLAVLVDGHVVLAPVVAEPLRGAFELSGRFSDDDVRLLLAALSPSGSR